MKPENNVENFENIVRPCVETLKADVYLNEIFLKVLKQNTTFVVQRELIESKLSEAINSLEAVRRIWFEESNPNAEAPQQEANAEGKSNEVTSQNYDRDCSPKEAHPSSITSESNLPRGRSTPLHVAEVLGDNVGTSQDHCSGHRQIEGQLPRMTSESNLSFEMSPLFMDQVLDVDDVGNFQNRGNDQTQGEVHQDATSESNSSLALLLEEVMDDDVGSQNHCSDHHRNEAHPSMTSEFYLSFRMSPLRVEEEQDFQTSRNRGSARSQKDETLYPNVVTSNWNSSFDTGICTGMEKNTQDFNMERDFLNSKTRETDSNTNNMGRIKTIVRENKFKRSMGEFKDTQSKIRRTVSNPEVCTDTSSSENSDTDVSISDHDDDPDFTLSDKESPPLKQHFQKALSAYRREKNICNESSFHDSMSDDKLPTDKQTLDAVNRSSNDVAASSSPNCAKIEKTWCKFCLKPIQQLSSHFRQCHSKEKEVAEFSSYPRNSKAQRSILNKLRSDGRLIHNKQVICCPKSELYVKRRPDPEKNTATLIDRQDRTQIANRKRGYCEICDRTYNYLWCHKINKHSDQRPHKCTRCSMSFKFANKLRRHELTVHVAQNRNTFQCDQCNYSYKYECILSAHIQQEHTGIRPLLFECNQCTHSYKSWQSLYNHMWLKHCLK